jgi:hypothetical protein
MSILVNDETRSDPKIWINTDNLLVFWKLQNALTGNYVNDATIVATLLDRSDTLLGTVSLSYLADSDGCYAGVLGYATTASLVKDTEYCIRYVVSKTGYRHERREYKRAGYLKPTD